MAKLSSPKIVVSIPRLAAYFVAACLVMYLLEASPQSTNNQPLQSAPASSHQTVLITPPPAVPLQPAPTPATHTATTTAKPATTTMPHSAQPAPVVTPAPSASVSGLAPVNPTPAPTAPNGTSNNTTPTQATTPVTSSYTSLNWTGYMATIGNYTDISGSWVVPNATGLTSYDAAWIGIGGVTTDDLIQVGTDNYVNAKGQEISAAFYEILPHASRTITALKVTPGDKMSASITEVATNEWRISITNTTTGSSYTSPVPVYYASSNSSAEWIEEDPSTTGDTLLPLDDFTPVLFTSAATTSKGSSLNLTTSNAQPVTMVLAETGKPVATPTTLGADGQSFTVNRNTTE